MNSCECEGSRAAVEGVCRAEAGGIPVGEVDAARSGRVSGTAASGVAEWGSLFCAELVVVGEMRSRCRWVRFGLDSWRSAHDWGLKDLVSENDIGLISGCHVAMISSDLPRIRLWGDVCRNTADISGPPSAKDRYLVSNRQWSAPGDQPSTSGSATN